MKRGIPTVGGAPAPETRKRVSGLVAFLVLLQIVIPLRYYLGDDPYDERFAWRMFSAVRVVRCNTGVVETLESGRRRPVRLMRTIHEAWVTNLRRNREDVVRAFLRLRCGEEDVREILLVNRCVDADRERLPDIVWSRDCESGEVDAPDLHLEPDGAEGSP